MKLKTSEILTLIGAAVVIISLVLLRNPAQPEPSASPVAQVTRATRTPTFIATAVPPTETPEPPSATPTNTPLPPTATPLPATATPTTPPTNTPAPTRVPPTPAPPTNTPVPASVDILSLIKLPNIEGGEGDAVINYEDWGVTSSSITVKAGDGHTYLCELGFLNRPESINRAREIWSYAQRGGGAWRWIIRVRQNPNWTSCGNERNVCYEGKTNSEQLAVNSEIYLKPHVWESLANDWLAGGWQATTRNGYYASIQHGIFKYVIDIDIDQPIIGFRFTRLD